MFIPRSDRDLARGRRAADICKAAGGTVKQCWDAAIDATFYGQSIHNRLKRECDLAIRKGASSDHVRAWYRPMAREVSGQSLADAIKTIRFNYVLKRQQFIRSRKLLYDPELMHAASAPHLHVERIYGALVILRLMRRKKFSDAQFWQIVDGVLGRQNQQLMAAE